MLSFEFQILVQIALYHFHTINSLEFTLSAGPSSLPTPLFGAVCALNSQNEWICIGGCNSYTEKTAHLCYVGRASKDIYLWDISHTASSVKIDSIDSVHNISYLWNPSNGYPYPIDLRNDVMYIAWNSMLYQYDTRNTRWVHQTIQIPTAVVYPCVVYDKRSRKIYLFGGTGFDTNNNQLYYGSVQVYDLNTLAWLPWDDIAPMPISVYGGSCVLHSQSNSIYYFGGRVQGGYAIKSIFKYQIDQNQWNQLSTELLYGSFGHRSIVLNQTNILIIGGAGFYPDNGASSSFRNKIIYNTDSGIWSFDVTNETVKLITIMQHYRYAAQSALINGHVYIAGGLTVDGFSGLILSDSEWCVETFDEYNMSLPSTSISPMSTTSQPLVSNSKDDSNNQSNSVLKIITTIQAIIALIFLFIFLIIIGFMCMFKNKRQVRQHIPSSSDDNIITNEPDEGNENVLTGNNNINIDDNDDEILMAVNQTNFDE